MNYLIQNFPLVFSLAGEHLRLVGISLVLALALALPLGLLVYRLSWLRGPVLAILGAVYTVPSLAFFILLLPTFGLGLTSAVIALVAYAQLMLVRSWLAGLTSINPDILEAADGMGMSLWQRFVKVEFPLSLPYLLAGIRLAALTIIAIGTIAAFINAGGLGRLLFEGVSTGNKAKILAGGLAVSFLAVFANSGLYWLERGVDQRLRGSEDPLEIRFRKRQI